MRATVLPAFLLLFLAAAWAAETAAQGGSATLVNHSGFDIHALYLSPSHHPQWGPDQLGQGILSDGGSFTLTGIPCGDYDVRLVDEDGHECVVGEQSLCGDAGDWILTAEELLGCEGFKVTTASATLTNRTQWDIYELYLSPSHESHWGPDQLGRQVLQGGASFTVSGLPCGDYDVRLVDEDGHECVVGEQSLCGDAGDWILTDEELLGCEGFKVATASATLTNRTRWDIYELYLSPSHESHWGPDQLGRQVLESGDSFTVSGVPCGEYDIKLVDEDEEECVLEEIHLCGSEGEAVLTDRELLACLGY